MKLKKSGNIMGMRNRGKIFVLGAVCCLLTGCGNVIPELTEEEASLIATYAADVVLESSKEDNSRLIDTQEETRRREELSEKVEELKEKKAKEEEQEEAEQSSGGSGGGLSNAQTVESMASFIGLPEFQVSYDGYEIKKSYAAEEGDEWEPTFDATSGKNLLIIHLKVTNITDAPAVADVLSKDMMFSVRGDQGINGMALTTLLLNDFAFAQDEIGAGESKQYVLIAQIDENITEVNSLSVQMKKEGESAVVTLQ